MAAFCQFLIATALLTACGDRLPESDTLAKVRARGELIWAADLQGGEPYVFEDPKDPTKLTGFETEIMDAIARRMGVRHRMVQFLSLIHI